MPCRDYYDDHPDQYFKDVTEPALKKQISFAESALCMVMNAYLDVVFNETALNEVSKEMLFDQVYDHFDYVSAGIKEEEFIKWHKEHMRLDAEHRAEEQRQKLAHALGKLTPDEFLAVVNHVKAQNK